MLRNCITKTILSQTEIMKNNTISGEDILFNFKRKNKSEEETIIE